MKLHIQESTVGTNPEPTRPEVGTRPDVAAPLGVKEEISPSFSGQESRNAIANAMLKRGNPMHLDKSPEGLAESSVSTPDKLMAMYLAGKLSQGDLVFALKAYNSVAADTMIRTAKHSPTVPIDYVEVPKASVDPITHEADKPLQGTTGTKNEKDAGKGLAPARDEHTKEQEKKNEEQEKQEQQEQRTQDVIQTEEIEQNNKQAVQAHVLREQLRQEELELEGADHGNSLTAAGGIADRAKKGSLDGAQRRIRGGKRFDEELKRRELLLLAQSIAGQDRSEDEDLEETEEEDLLDLIGDWELLAGIVNPELDDDSAEPSPPTTEE